MEKEYTRVPTLEEFAQIVRTSFEPLWLALSKKTVDNYFNSEEIKNIIAREYRDNLEEYNNGKLLLSVFWQGSAYSVAYCLSLMYDGPIE